MKNEKTLDISKSYISEKMMYVQKGVEFYILGRRAFFWNYTQIAGDLFHQSFELLLKSNLLNKYSEKDLRLKFDHKLPEIWKESKKLFEVDKPRSGLDNVIEILHKWWEMRYPFYPNKKPFITTFLLDKNSDVKLTKDKEFANIKREYVLVLEDIDKLFREIVLKMPLRPDSIRHFITYPLNKETNIIYQFKNKYKLWVTRRDGFDHKLYKDDERYYL